MQFVKIPLKQGQASEQIILRYGKHTQILHLVGKLISNTSRLTNRLN